MHSCFLILFTCNYNWGFYSAIAAEGKLDTVLRQRWGQIPLAITEINMLICWNLKKEGFCICIR